MSSLIKAAVGLALAVTIVTAIVFAGGLYENPAFSAIFTIVAITLNIAAVFWGLSQTAAVSGYGKQVLNAVIIGVVAGVLIFASSMLMTTVVFPDAFQDSTVAAIEQLEANPQLEGEALEGMIKLVTSPVVNAVSGTAGTLFTSLIAGLIVAVFKRKK